MDLSITCSVLTREKLLRDLPVCLEALQEFPREYWQQEHFLRELPDKWELSVVAQQSGRWCGFIIASRKDCAAHIHKFIVLQEARASGIGGALQRYFVERCRRLGLSEVTLWVYADNAGAIRFYERHGFAVTSKRREAGEELYLMTKRVEVK